MKIGQIGDWTDLSNSSFANSSRDSLGSLPLSLRSSLGHSLSRSFLSLLSVLLGVLLCFLGCLLSSLNHLLGIFLRRPSRLLGFLLGSLVGVLHSLGGSSVGLPHGSLGGSLGRFLGPLSLPQNCLILGHSSSTPFSLLGPGSFARGAVQGLLASQTNGTHMKAWLMGMMAARSAADKRVKVVRAGLVADGAFLVDRLRSTVSQSRVSAHLCGRQRIDLEIGKQLLELCAEKGVLPAKGLLGLHGEGQEVCWRLDGSTVQPNNH